MGLSRFNTYEQVNKNFFEFFFYYKTLKYTLISQLFFTQSIEQSPQVLIIIKRNFFSILFNKEISNIFIEIIKKKFLLKLNFVLTFNCYLFAYYMEMHKNFFLKIINLLQN
jgi:hypothetical protein